MDHRYLSKLDNEQYNSLHWIATHVPRPTRLQDLPENKRLRELWNKLSFYHDDKKIFPLLDHHKFSAKKFGLPVLDPFKPGIPPSVLEGLMSNFPPLSYVKIYKSLYSISYYHTGWKMRICECSYGLIKNHTSFSDKTIYRCLDYFRSLWFVRILWRGRPSPENNRYLHSCYELPYSFNHVLYWRINNGRKRR